MSPIPLSITILLLITLVPIVPAFILFKFLPATAAVTGPFKGLRIDLSGSFAAYFLVFFVLVGIRHNFDTDYEMWMVRGRIIQADVGASPYIDPRFVTFSVPALKSDADGNFSISFVRTSDHEFDFPYMYISIPGYSPKAFFLGPKSENTQGALLPANIDPKTRVIDIGTVQLTKLDATTAGGANPYVVANLQQ